MCKRLLNFVIWCSYVINGGGWELAGFLRGLYNGSMNQVNIHIHVSDDNHQTRNADKKTGQDTSQDSGDTDCVREYYDEVYEVANGAIEANEKVIDIQSVVTSIGLLGLIFHLLENVSDINIYTISAIVVSLFILIISFGIYMNFSRQNRRMLNEMEDEWENQRIKTVEDVQRIREKYINDGTHGKVGRWFGVSGWELLRFVLLVLFLPPLTLFAFLGSV